MIVIELLEWGKNTLKEHANPAFAVFASPTLDAEVLLADTLGIGTSELFSRLQQDVVATEEEQYRSHIARRLAHEPVAYITGKKAFWNRTFCVTQDTLIPRPETENVIEEALRIWQEYEKAGERLLFLDIGTGSGAIAVTLAAETHGKVLAGDISADALAVAQTNAAQYHVDDQITFGCGNLLEPLLDLLREIRPAHTLIAANLPYLTVKQWELAQPEVHEWEPRIALEAGLHGLDTYWMLLRQLTKCRHLLGTSCTLLCEIDPSQETKLPLLIRESFPKSAIEVLQDLARHPRIVRASL